jgi:hypothetical protein
MEKRHDEWLTMLKVTFYPDIFFSSIKLNAYFCNIVTNKFEDKRYHKTISFCGNAAAAAFQHYTTENYS